MPDIELTDEERANGWTPEKLKAYFAERERAQSGVILFNTEFRKPVRPRFANSGYSIHRWRR